MANQPLLCNWPRKLQFRQNNAK